jgi:prepilin-type N-terminal cleavage/methylation domain-containing protein
MSRRIDAGFTLIELLVTLAIFGLMSALLSGGLHSLGHTVESGTHRLDRAAQLTLTSNFLHRVVADARPLPDPAAGDGSVMFEGAPGAMQFVGAPPAMMARGGFHAMRLELDGRGGRRQLVFRSGMLGDGKDLSRSILLDDVAAAHFAYFGRTARTEPADWHDRWPGAAGLPDLVRLRITFADGSSAPDLVIAPRPTDAGSP